MGNYRKTKIIILSFVSVLLVGGVVLTLFLTNNKKFGSDGVEPSDFKELQNGSEQIAQETEDDRLYIFSDSPSKEETSYVIKDFSPIKKGMTFSQVYDILGGRKANKLTKTSGVSPKQVYELIGGGEIFIAYSEDKVNEMLYYESENDENGIDILSEGCTLWDEIH